MNTNSNLEFRKIKSLKFLYEVNENGTIIRNVKSKKQLKIKLDFHHSEKGYYTTFVHIGGRSENSRIIRVPIHKVVAECWLGDCPTGYEVDHIDRNTHNNHYSNLRYVTKSRESRSKGIKLRNCNTGEIKEFNSIAEASRFLEQEYDTTFERMRSRIKDHRKHIYDYDVIYVPIKFF